jgi:hypothetical protein
MLHYSLTKKPVKYQHKIGIAGRYLLVGVLLAGPGCASTKSKQAEPARPAGLTAAQLNVLDQSTYGFADRLVTLLSEACDRASEGHGSDEARRTALRIKLFYSSSAYSIATGPNPLGKLMDFLTIVTLGYLKWVEQGEAKTVFEDQASFMEHAFRTAHDDIWKLAAKYIAEDAQKEVRDLINRWYKENPEVTLTAFVRFDDFATSRVAKGGGDSAAHGLFSQLAAANENIESSRLLAERAFFYVKRAPRLLQWQAERTLEALLDHPDVRRAMDDAHETSGTIRQIGAEIQRLDERNAMVSNRLFQVQGILDRADEVSRTVQSSMRDSEKAFVAIRDAGASLTETLGVAGRLYTQVNSNSVRTVAREPFDIKQYAAAATELANATRAMDALMQHTEGMVGSDLWSQRVNELNLTAQKRVDHAARRTIHVILLFFALLLLTQVILICLRRSHHPVHNHATSVDSGLG